MFSTTLKRSAATLGVVAGLLAAAAPAGAQFWEGMSLRSQAPVNASAGISGKEMTDAVKAPASPTSGVFTSVSNVAPLHGDATTIWVWHEAVRGFTVEVGMGMSEDFLKAPERGAANDVSQLSLTQQGTHIGNEG